MVARKDRRVLMDQRDHEFENAIVLEQWLRTRERMKIELGIELRGDLTLEDEKFLKSQIDQREERSKLLAKEAQECQKKLQEMEASFTRLKQVTGVKNVEEMHEKFFNQRTNKFQLVEKDVPEMKKRLEDAKNQFLKVENDFKSMKSSGVGLEEVTRDSIDTLKTMAHEAKIDQKAINADAERIASVLVCVLLQSTLLFTFAFSPHFLCCLSCLVGLAPRFQWVGTASAALSVSHRRRCFRSNASWRGVFTLDRDSGGSEYS